MQKKLSEYKKQYIAMAVILLLTVFTTFSVYNDIRNNATKISQDTLSNNASLFTTYFNDVLKEKIVNLEQLSKKIDSSVMKDTDKLKNAASSYYRWFSSVAILDEEGNLKYGEKITRDLSKEEIFSQVMYGKQTLIYDKTVCDRQNKDLIVICTPIEEKSRTIGMLQGMILVSEINNFLDQWESSQKDSVFLMTEEGEYLSNTEVFRRMVGRGSYNFYDYLANCNMEGDVKSSSDMESAVKKRQTAFLNYHTNGKDYVGLLTPTEYGSWYIGYLSNIDYFKDAFNLSKETVFFIMLSLGFWGVWIITFFYITHRNSKYHAELERYKIVHWQEKSIIFDFSFEPKKLQFFGDVKEMFGYEYTDLLGEEVYEIYQYIHKDDASVRGRIHQFYDSDDKEFSAEVRIKKANGEYGWYRISGALIKDQRYDINRNFIGKVESADEQIVKEKNLVERSENDLLTGVLNKKTMEEKVVKSLETVYGSHHYVFFMVDLDNFKNVNDNLGHIVGDKAIIDTAECLKEVFRNNAHIGRLGGDEFAVCAFFDAFDEESLYKFIRTKAEKICELNRRTYTNSGKEVSISSSVGIAIAPDFAEDFETLYKMADSALYRSKNGGKNCYHIYDEMK